jgi:hypothetical protein
MDPLIEDERVRERAETVHLEPPLVNTPLWLAEDPETECQGAGKTERAATENLVRAVRASREDGGASEYLSAGRRRTVRMAWREGEGPAQRLRSLLERLRP